MSEFVEFLKEVFARFGAINPRKMFGGYGLYHDGVMFGLVVDDTLYLKADNSIVHYFEEKNLPAFSYNRQNKIVHLSYFQVPDEIYDDTEMAAIWAKRSFEVAYRASKLRLTVFSGN